MKVEIEKITNGYVVNIDGKKTFCDVAEAICGLTSEAVLAEVSRLDRGGKSSDEQMKSSLVDALKYMQAQYQVPLAGDRQPLRAGDTVDLGGIKAVVG